MKGTEGKGGIWQFEEVAAEAWNFRLSSRLVADIKVRRRNATLFVSGAYKWIDTDKALISQTTHQNNNDAVKAENAVNKIDKALRGNKTQKEIVISLSGFDILALKNVAPDPQEFVRVGDIALNASARTFLAGIEDAYIKNPDKYDPREKGFIQQAIRVVKKGLRHKAK